MLKKLTLIALTLLALLPTPTASQAIRAWAEDRQEFAPTLFHVATYHLMEQCTGILGNVHNVRWFTASALTDLDDPAISYMGIWQAQTDGSHEITFAYDYTFHLTIIAHEILHDLFYGAFPKEAADKCIPRPGILRILSDSTAHDS